MVTEIKNYKNKQSMWVGIAKYLKEFHPAGYDTTFKVIGENKVQFNRLRSC